MCTGLELAAVAAGLSAAGSGAEMYANKQQLNKQNDLAAAGIIKQGAINKQAEGDVAQTTKTLAQSNADSQAASAKQLADYQHALQQSSAISGSATPNVPGASKAYAATEAKNAPGVQDYLGKIANSAATTQGTQLERVGEGQAMAGTATNLGLLGQQSNEQDYLTKLQMQATQANPWLMGLGATLRAAGAGMGASAGWASAAPPQGGVAAVNAMRGAGVVPQTI